MKNTIIFGAKSKALSAYFAIRELYKDVNVVGFVVGSRSGNPQKLAGLPVFELHEFKDKSVHVVIATPEDVQDEICSLLDDAGFTDYSKIDSKKECGLMEKYFDATGQFTSVRSLPLRDKNNNDISISSTENLNPVNPMPFISASDSTNSPIIFDNTKGNATSKIKLYGTVDEVIKVGAASFCKDKPLKGKAVMPSWVHKIQVGAALTDERVSDICDNEGDNISHKNPNYCELTALYWMWKNQELFSVKYYGLFHYRRILNLSDEDIGKIVDNDIDVILPFPMMNEPDIKEHHRRYLKESDWEAMLSALKELEPGYYAAYDEIFSGRYMYNYNIIVAKEKVMDDYCSWLFPILKRTEELSDPKGCERADRYIGYMGENLLTLYFMKNKDRYKTAHAGVVMLR